MKYARVACNKTCMNKICFIQTINVYFLNIGFPSKCPPSLNDNKRAKWVNWRCYILTLIRTLNENYPDRSVECMEDTELSFGVMSVSFKLNGLVNWHSCMYWTPQNLHGTHLKLSVVWFVIFTHHISLSPCVKELIWDN